MDFETFRAWFTLENIMNLIQDYKALGPLPGILLTILEAFLPFLPLFLFVMANASAFGLWLGFLYSWLGACIGALLVFSFIRKYSQKRLLAFLPRHQKVRRLMDWVERHGFGPLFLLLCFPFTPSAVVNIVAGLSKLSFAQYMLAVCIGKMVMIFTISFIGYDIRSLVTQPFRTIIVFIIIFILWVAGKRIEARLNKNVKNDHVEEKRQGKELKKRRG
ncbi:MULTISPECIES: TVP38/TMEM64 family protein [Neobacillus]|uniref:TVP38/TMEM64 family membrane protein n=1 Tax=Neobacillus rhizophilus TaxID=2833579 RepID=A0A942U766_9BACI|nr:MULTISPECIES: TVP38/TMEM64 family protein [Neobacillus]MBS4212199.1 TVP38/TMEM64 family protein [Neobacillus rhizophilus]MBU8915628.1 TVP38/TMEM64 family protein [Bacillus sp. FJAT-29953]